jgi:hypothetical protein
VADGQRRRSGPVGTDPPSASAQPASARRHVLAPANDNALTPSQRIMRAVAFVAIGVLLAWLLRMLAG